MNHTNNRTRNRTLEELYVANEWLKSAQHQIAADTAWREWVET